MKILLDENLPVKLKRGFSSNIEVYTVYDMKWNSFKDSELLKSLDENNFDALITSDKNIIYQHKLSKYQFRFIIILASDNQYQTLLPLIPLIERAVLSPGKQVVHVDNYPV